jgi:fructose-1,6-bisphosphatase/sedoheptulose 1,7-bisphosphatase-like protein
MQTTIDPVAQYDLDAATTRAELVKIESMISARFATLQAIAEESTENDEYIFGYRCNPHYVAMQLAMNLGIKADELTDGDVIAAILCAANADWVYADRGNRG